MVAPRRGSQYTWRRLASVISVVLFSMALLHGSFFLKVHWLRSVQIAQHVNSNIVLAPFLHLWEVSS